MNEKKTSIVDEMLDLFAPFNSCRCEDLSQQFMNNKIHQEASQRIEERLEIIKPALSQDLQRELDQIECDNGLIVSEAQKDYYRYGFENGMQFATGVIGEQNTTNCSKRCYVGYGDIESKIKKFIELLSENVKIDPKLDAVFTDLMNNRLGSEALKMSSKYFELTDMLSKMKNKVIETMQEGGQEFVNEWDALEGQLIGVVLDDTYKFAFRDGAHSVIKLLLSCLLINE